MVAEAFLRGNLHTHSTRSDGDSDPAVVYAWYRDHGYAFVAMTDHNSVTDPAEFRALATPTFTLLRGEEVTMTAEGKPVHVNAICASRSIGGGQFTDKPAALAWAIGQVHGAGGVALVNHPNFEWALDEALLVGMPRAELVEIASGHPYVRWRGEATRPSAEALWARHLDAGGDAAPGAVDDAHHLLPDAEVEGEPARPGKAWVEVFGGDRAEAAICAALREKRFVASTGVSLRRLVVDGAAFEVEPAVDARVEFVGEGSRVLAEARAGAGKPARHDLGAATSGYVRARVTADDGAQAWTKAYRVLAAR